MPDVCDLILDDHTTFRRRFSELDELRQAGAQASELGQAWAALARLLDVHAAAEEELFYPQLLRWGADGKGETTDAINDHNKIRDAVRAARGHEVGEAAWWAEVSRAREANSRHMSEEELGAISDFRLNTAASRRRDLGAEWVEFEVAHAEGVPAANRDPQRYVEDHAVPPDR